MVFKYLSLSYCVIFVFSKLQSSKKVEDISKTRLAIMISDTNLNKLSLEQVEYGIKEMLGLY